MIQTGHGTRDCDRAGSRGKRCRQGRGPAGKVQHHTGNRLQSPCPGSRRRGREGKQKDGGRQGEERPFSTRREKGPEVSFRPLCFIGSGRR
ncbi:hypothetical protein DESPIGER_1997 [Desulfovibrio piger]|uniref:Uncharacterized protein n=1 Tax=Desulfovibrio piger TaxID=901 RepID=A0A1K1LGI1_9BACT|nr:hypothetical protein DESPIGER_1997 [Desulfovibrio piger]